MTTYKSATALRNDWLFSKYQFIEQKIKHLPCYNCEGIFDVNLYLHSNAYFCHDCAVMICEQQEAPDREQILEFVENRIKQLNTKLESKPYGSMSHGQTSLRLRECKKIKRFIEGKNDKA